MFRITCAITREELGEYLIARHGADRLQHLVNKRIIELACQAHGIQVSDKEIDAALAEDLASLKVSAKEFEEKTLKDYGKSLYEWREDVIRPKLYMTKLCQDSVDVTPDDLKFGVRRLLRTESPLPDDPLAQRPKRPRAQDV